MKLFGGQSKTQHKDLARQIVVWSFTFKGIFGKWNLI